ncbi:glycosyltransferase family 2 protein [Methanothermobacter sp. KEPCO-1]|uniref:glycosyltransferase family 2 protein n=1 Tax=Methanothermobacter TaxID=145260 RepID=UPI0011C712CD|nr:MULTISPECIES: glycosyltransferase family 2 protein [unclassified Methanothermobacter]QEF93769.1 glycosyltransferase family 2 protein [Methanothermobacter sp. KEPCO-1]
MRIVTVIPAFNEERAVESVVRGALEHGDVILVDDGSTDGTAELGEAAGARVIRHPENLGKGAALKTGIRAALEGDYDVIVFMDADGQHDPSLIPQLASAVNGGDFIIGSRFLGNKHDSMPLHRQLSNRITTWILRMATGYEITDSQSGFRAISARCAHLILNIPHNDYVYESEAICKTSRHRLRIAEVPINCTYGDEKSYIGAGDVLRYIRFILRLFLRRFSAVRT